MSNSTYALQTSRTRQRPPPPPLRFDTPSRPTSIVKGDRNSTTQTLLYDLPAATSPSATSPGPSTSLVSPSSASYPGRSRTPRNVRPTPPPSARKRSTTPSGVTKSDLEKFADFCRLWYFSQDEEAGRQMTQTLANIPPAQRAPYSRLQASVRSAYHASVNARRHAEFQAHISTTQPGGSLMPHSRANPGGSMAQKERFDRLERFVQTWCTTGMPGTKPFFEGLWAVMRLQVIPEQIGGAGGNRIEWEIDDAVFKEAAGKDFMLDAIDVLKGVLGFEELSSTKTSPISGTFTTFSTAPPAHARAISQPLQTNRPHQTRRSSITTTTTVKAKRPRAPSDPFSDNSTLDPTDYVRSFGRISPAPDAANDGGEDAANDGDLLLRTCVERSTFEESDKDHLRVWTVPDLPNPEFVSLLKVFPTFITRRPLPRFPPSDPHRQPDIEEGDNERGEGKEIQFGTGSMWVSSRQREDGFEGGWWTRFVLWLRRLLC